MSIARKAALAPAFDHLPELPPGAAIQLVEDAARAEKTKAVSRHPTSLRDALLPFQVDDGAVADCIAAAIDQNAPATLSVLLGLWPAAVADRADMIITASALEAFRKGWLDVVGMLVRAGYRVDMLIDPWTKTALEAPDPARMDWLITRDLIGQEHIGHLFVDLLPRIQPEPTGRWLRAASKKTLGTALRHATRRASAPAIRILLAAGARLDTWDAEDETEMKHMVEIRARHEPEWSETGANGEVLRATVRDALATRTAHGRLRMIRVYAEFDLILEAALQAASKQD